MPPSAAIGDSTDFAKEFIEQSLSVKEPKIPAQFRHVERPAVGAQERAYVLEIPRAAWIVDERLELEADQPLRADDAKVAKCGLELPCPRQQTARNGAARVQEVDALVAARA